MHALIIDDNAQNVAVLAQMLARQDITSEKLMQPERLPDVLATLPRCDIVFVDLEMPKVDGYAVYTMLRADQRFDGVPIVACTVHLNDIVATHDHGFDGFIGKPLDARKFPAQVRRILNGEPVWETA